MNGSKTTLADKMRARADRDGLPADHEMRKLADAFDRASVGHLSTPQTVAVRGFFGAWAKARGAWSRYTGEAIF